MQFAFRSLKVRISALLFYLLECQVLFLCFTYILCTVVLTIWLKEFAFGVSTFPSSTVLLLMSVSVLAFLVSYFPSTGVYNLGTAVRLTSVAVFLSVISSTIFCCKIRNEVENFQSFIGSESEFLGKISSSDGKGGLVMNGSHKLLGRVLIKESGYSVLRVGEECSFKGKVVEPGVYDGFDYKTYLYQKQIYGILKDPVYRCSEKIGILHKFRNSIEEHIGKSIPEPESSLLIGILLGTNRAFTDTFENAVKSAGISHVVAASGYNVSMLVLSVESVLRFLPRRIRIFLQIIFIWLYTGVAGFSASLLRATTMTSVSLISRIAGRSSTVHCSVFLCIVVLITVNPFVIFDVGFLLSLFSTLALIYLLPSIDTNRVSPYLREYLLPTFVCTLITFPITVSIFKKLSITSILVNFLALPIISSTMTFGILSVCASMLFPKLDFLLAIPYVQLVVFKNIVLLFSKIELLDIRISPVVMVVFGYTLILLFCLYKYPVINEKDNYYILKAKKYIKK